VAKGSSGWLGGAERRTIICWRSSSPLSGAQRRSTDIGQKKYITEYLSNNIIQLYKINSAYTPPPSKKYCVKSKYC